MAVSTQAMNQAWNALVIRKTARTNPALLHYLLNKEDPQYTTGEEEDPNEWAEYGMEPTPLEGEEPLARRHEMPPHIGEDTYEPLGINDNRIRRRAKILEAMAAAGESTPAEGPVAVKPPSHETPGDKDEDDEDTGVAPVPKP